MTGEESILLSLAALLAVAGGVGCLLLRRRLVRSRKETADLRQALAEQEGRYIQLLADKESAHQVEREGFRGALAHSLRIPLAIIQGYVELLCGGYVPDGDAQREYLRKIADRTAYMTKSLTRLLADSRGDEAIIPRFAPVELVGLLRQIIDDMKNPAAAQGVHIQLLCAESAITLHADSFHLTRVFFNLIENSFKYMGREGLITIRVQTEEGLVRILFQDDGLGLPEQETGHIFERNFQGSNKAGGHGHGLYLVKSVIEAHGGQISAESRPGQGMGILIRLPLDAAVS